MKSWSATCLPPGTSWLPCPVNSIPKNAKSSNPTTCRIFATAMAPIVGLRLNRSHKSRNWSISTSHSTAISASRNAYSSKSLGYGDWTISMRSMPGNFLPVSFKISGTESFLKPSNSSIFSREPATLGASSRVSNNRIVQSLKRLSIRRHWILCVLCIVTKVFLTSSNLDFRLDKSEKPGRSTRL